MLFCLRALSSCLFVYAAYKSLLYRAREEDDCVSLALERERKREKDGKTEKEREKGQKEEKKMEKEREKRKRKGTMPLPDLTVRIKLEIGRKVLLRRMDLDRKEYHFLTTIFFRPSLGFSFCSLNTFRCCYILFCKVRRPW